MNCPIDRHLSALSQKDPDMRKQAVADMLSREHIFYEIQKEDPSVKNPRGAVNYLFSSTDAASKKPCLLFCAHYDAVPGCFGANDNAAALCILTDLARALKEEEIPARFAFFDGEENGNTGSRLYADLMEQSSLAGVINLDVCGYGDSLVICGKGYEKKPVFRSSFCKKELLKKYNGQVVKFLPKSDDVSFRGRRLPVLSMAAVPRWDVQYLKTLATYGSGILGRPPEFDMILGQMEVITTMHGGYRDAPEWVEPETMERFLSYLLEGARLWAFG